MSFLNGMTAHLFRTDPVTGQTIIYPNGVLGCGYIVPGKDALHRLERSMRVAMALVLGVSIAGTQLIVFGFGAVDTWPTWLWAGMLAVWCAMVLAWRIFVVAKLAKGLEPASMRLSLKESMAAQTVALPRWYLRTMAVLGPLLLIGSVMMLLEAQSVVNVVSGSIGVVLFTAASVQGIIGLRRTKGAAPNRGQ